MPNFKKQLLDDIDLYCKLNSLDIDKFCNDLLEQAFVSKKYGTIPNIIQKKGITQKDSIEPNEETPTIITKKIDTDDDDYYKAL